MADYFGHWLSFAERDGLQLPRIYHVNWFRKDTDGKFIWPGFAENARVLKWIFQRGRGEVDARETAIGRLPYPQDIDLEGLELDQETLAAITDVDTQGWKQEIDLIRQHYERFGERLPKQLREELKSLDHNLSQPH
jgi:phosphoenolpyruvate carboxykinase (GTP)